MLRARDRGGHLVGGATTNRLIGTSQVAVRVHYGLSEAAGIFALLAGTAAGWLSDGRDNRLLLSLYGFRGLWLVYLPFAFDADLRPTCVQRGLRPRLDRQRAANSKPSH